MASTVPAEELIPTKFSYVQYQALMLVLAAIMCLTLVVVEFMMKRFQILPVLFPGMFSIRERRFFFFDSVVEDESIRLQLRGEAKLLLRVVLCVVLSYLWQHCVLRTAQIVGQEFPRNQCRDDMDCFASELTFSTLLTWKYKGVNCADCVDHGQCPEFVNRVVVSCIRFVPPSATDWLMHLAIAHSVTQMTLKSFEVLVWQTGNSPLARKLMGFIACVFGALLLVLYFSNILTEFVSDWVTFVMSMSVPAFFYTVWSTSRVLQVIWMQECCKVQSSLEEHLNAALADFPLDPEGTVSEIPNGEESTPQEESESRRVFFWGRSKSVFSTGSRSLSKPSLGRRMKMPGGRGRHIFGRKESADPEAAQRSVSSAYQARAGTEDRTATELSRRSH